MCLKIPAFARASHACWHSHRRRDANRRRETRQAPRRRKPVLHIPGRVRRHFEPMVRASTVVAALRNFPIVTAEALVGDRPLLVLAPHPDDESLGCGGLLASLAIRGHVAHVLVLTDGAASHRSREYDPARLAALRMDEEYEALEALGLGRDRVTFLGLRDGEAPLRGPKLSEAAARVAVHARALGVGTICTTWLHEPSPDHLAAHRIGRLAAQEIGARLYHYPVWTWTVPPQAWLADVRMRGLRVDIAGVLAAKQRAIRCHRSQYAGLITDDPRGFQMATEFMRIFDWPFEVFVEPE
jgi:LmbE family N-acetylglucosaminyl deacetylase